MVQYEFSGQTAVVTGGAQGIGFAIVKRLVDAGARVSMWDVDKAGAAAAVKALGGSPAPIGFRGHDARAGLPQR